MSDDFRALLRAHRERRRWSQERCAAECEMDHSLVSRIEGGQRNPTREAVEKLIAGLQLPDDAADALRIAAGYVPVRRGSMVADEPAVALAYMLLHDPTIAGEVKEAVREQLRGLVAVANNTARVHPRTGASLGLPVDAAALGGGEG